MTTPANARTESNTRGDRPEVTVITGGSRGIGAATALRLANDEPGRTLLLSYANDRSAADEVAAAVVAAGGRAEVHRADVAAEDDVVALFEAADRMGRVSGLVNNAGLLFTAAGWRTSTSSGSAGPWTST